MSQVQSRVDAGFIRPASHEIARFRAAPNHLAGDSGPSELGYSQTAPRCLPRGRPRSRPAQPTPMRSRSPSLGVYVNFVPCCRGATLTFSLLGY